MAINQNRPVISYENIALFQSQTPAHSAASNSGSNLSFLPLVQGIDFSVDFQRNNAGQIGSKNFANQSFQNAPDVNLTINTFEDFGNLFSCLSTGGIIREDLDSDRNFYAYIAPERGVDANKDRIANDVRYYCIESLSSADTDVAIPYPGTTLYEEDFDGSNRTVLNTYTEPTGVEIAVTSGKVYYGDKPTHWHGEGYNHALIPFHLAGKQFGFRTIRYAPNRISVLSLEDNADVDVYVNVTNGINGTATYSASLNAGETYVFEDSTEIATIIIVSTKNILCSKESYFSDKLLLAPIETDVYRTRNEFEYNVLNTAPQIISNYHVYDPSGVFANDVADSYGSDAVGHIGYNKLTKYQTFSSSESTFIGTDTPNWTVVAPYPDTDINISYYSGSSWHLWSGFNLDGTKTNPAVNYDFDPLIGVRLWKMESTKPVAFFINDDENDEEILIGWNDEHLPENQTSFGQFLSFGNCFLNNISISQSINGLMQSQYSFTASNVQAEEVNAHDVGFDGLLYTGVSVPSIDLTGDGQPQDLLVDISGINNYYTNNDPVIPYYDTNVLISGSGSFGNFLINSESIQSFDLNLPINRKTIYSLGKKYPVKRKALFPSEGSFSFTNKTDDFYVNGERANLNDFLNYDEFYTIFISGSTSAYEDFVYQIQSGKLNSMNLSNSIGSNTENSLSFSFEVNNSSIDFSLINQLGDDIDGEVADDGSGFSVSINSAGDRIAIGAIYNDGGGLDRGYTRIYQWNGSSWTQLGNNIDGEADYDWSGYSVSINAAGDRVAIGAIGNGNSSGHVRIYEWNGSSWIQLGSDIDGEATYDQSGNSVSINAEGNRVAIGAISNDGNGTNSGHTRIYEWNGSSWTQLGSDIDGEADWDKSGYSVSMNSTGNRVAIGAIWNDGGGGNSGHTRIYEWRQYTDNDVGSYHHTSRVQNNTTQLLPLIITENSSTAPVVGSYYWTQLGFDIDGEVIGDQSGYSVSMNAAGDRVAIGAVYNDGNGNSSGHVRIYQWNGSSWTQLGSDIDGEAANDQSGGPVSMNAAGDRVAIGAIFNNGGGNNSGHTRIYEYNTNTTSWVKLGQDIDGEAAYDYSGYSVSINAEGNRVAIGAYSGHVRIYQLSNRL